ncbi:MAG TPA: hypothetical protein VGL39_26850 [Jatrophihabitantaceae bacterium]
MRKVVAGRDHDRAQDHRDALDCLISARAIEMAAVRSEPKTSSRERGFEGARGRAGAGSNGRERAISDQDHPGEQRQEDRRLGRHTDN